ncbi:MAG: dihydromethanopterin reductase (acceptor) [Methanobrevibacter sp.]|jgi:dihydromethanopterin reductase (acceptor)|nr:dihydromethanopterin reductase (acceptor) [Methanobrevibacter sp.]
MRIAWAFTGAGHLLKESVEIAENLSKIHDLTILLSCAAEEVLKMYGLYDKIVSLTGDKYNELVLDFNQKFSYPITGRFSLGKYDLLIVSPTTANTVSKIVHGISDNLVTNAVSQAGKGAVNTIIVPVDLNSDPVDTVLPSKLELNKCENCKECVSSIKCPNNAIIPHSEINLLKCSGCGTCKNTCPYGAISEGKIVTIYMRDIDIENTKKLYSIGDITVFESPKDILDYLKDY